MSRQLAEAIGLLPGASAFSESLGFYESARSEVATLALSQIAGRDSVVLDAGSTAYLIAEGLRDGHITPPGRVLTPNLAVSLCLAGSSVSCTQLGGEVDDLHCCTIVTDSSLDLALSPEQARASTFVLSAAACRIDDEGLWIRARRPDQFELKRNLVARCGTVILAVEAAKFTDPFDGVHAFLLDSRPLTVLTDSSLLRLEQLRQDLKSACIRSGYSLVEAGT